MRSNALVFMVVPHLTLPSTAFAPPPSRATCRRPTSPPHLVPFSEAWRDAARDDGRRASFASLVPGLGRPSLDADGALTLAAPPGDDGGGGGGGDERRYRLYLATDFDDLPPIARLTVDVFDTAAITLSRTSDWSALERAVAGATVEPVLGLYNAYAGAVAYTEVLAGLRRRISNRDGDSSDRLAPLMVPPDETTTAGTSRPRTGKAASLEDVAARSSLIFALARPPGNRSPSEEGGGDVEVVATVELRLQPTDAKIPFSQPWLDKIERRLARALPFATEETTPGVATTTTASSGGGTPLRPYLCNLAVAPALRSLGVGRALCRVVEAVARDRWGHSRLYLHVDPDNRAALALYESEGYVDVGRRWNAAWAGDTSGIGYYVKRLGEAREGSDAE